MRQEELLIEHDEHLRTLPRHGCKGTVQRAGLAHVEELRLQSQHLSYPLRFSHDEGMNQGDRILSCSGEHRQLRRHGPSGYGSGLHGT